jgi:hypothetical protein
MRPLDDAPNTGELLPDLLADTRARTERAEVTDARDAIDGALTDNIRPLTGDAAMSRDHARVRKYRAALAAARMRGAVAGDRAEVARTAIALADAEHAELVAKVARVERFHAALVILGNLPIEERPDGLTASVKACAALADDLRDALDGAK